jgi:hypothetical protein
VWKRRLIEAFAIITVGDGLEAVMNLLRNSLLMRKTGDRRRTELTEIFAFLCGFPAEFITRSNRVPGSQGAFAAVGGWP